MQIKILFVTLLGWLAFSPLQADEASEAQKTVEAAHESLKRFLVHDNLDWMQENIKTANGVMLIPKMVTGGLIIGGSAGHALLFSRDPQSGTWSGPAFYKVGAASIGVQAGGKVEEIMMLVRSEKALRSLLTNTGKFSAAGSVTVGPVGEGAGVNINAELVTYSLSKGLFGGGSLGASGSEVNAERNEAYYGKAATPEEILIDRSVSSSGSAAILTTLAEASR